MGKIFLFYIMFLGSFSASAAEESTLSLTGTVDTLMSISFEDSGAAASLDLNTALDLEISQLHIISNSSSGYEVKLLSANLGNLVHTSVSAYKIPYTISAEGSTTLLALTPVDGVTIGTGNGEAVDITFGVNIQTVGTDVNFLGNGTDKLLEGQYTDTITATITAV
jgi:hypothetical protein